eukprot:9287794-Lingulodinium_polyedra.AAC.1
MAVSSSATAAKRHTQLFTSARAELRERLPEGPLRLTPSVWLHRPSLERGALAMLVRLANCLCTAVEEGKICLSTAKS